MLRDRSETGVKRDEMAERSRPNWWDVKSGWTATVEHDSKLGLDGTLPSNTSKVPSVMETNAETAESG